VASATSHQVARLKTLRPVATRKIGYQRNELPMKRGDLAAIVLAEGVQYADGTPIEDLKPAELGATDGAQTGVNLVNGAGTAVLTDPQIVTAQGTAAAITGQGTLATQNNVNLGTQVTGTLGTGNAASGLVNTNISIAANGALTGGGGGQVTIGGLGYTGALNATYGARAGTNIYRTDGATVMAQAEIRTAEGVASAITGQGALATKSNVSWLTEVANRPAVDQLYYDFNFASISAFTSAGHYINNQSSCSFVDDGTSPGGKALLMGDGVTGEGEIGFDVSRIAAAVTGRIKETAARRIEAVAPIWRQLNDLADPTNPDHQRRRQQIDAIRAWSNEAERKLRHAHCVSDVVAVLADLEEGN